MEKIKQNGAEDSPKDLQDIQGVLEEKSVLPPIEKIVERIDANNLMIKHIPYELVENYRDAFDEEEMNKRFNSLLEKYDFIVGDVSDEKVRLKGFYRNDYKKAPDELRIESLEDYLLEYCNFGCAYYVLKRADGRKGVLPIPRKEGRKPANRRRRDSKRPDSKPHSSRKQSPKKAEGKKNVSKKGEGKRPLNKKTDSTQPDTNRARTATKPVMKREDNTKKPRRSFEKKEVKPTKPNEPTHTGHVETVKDEKGKPKFHIRKNISDT